MLVSPSQKKILTILADGQFHSGTKLAEKLGISRSAISKQLKQLNESGIEFNAISGKGYRLEYELQLLSKNEIEKQLSATANGLIAELEIHDCIHSTNSYLVEKAQLNKSDLADDHAIVCLAEYQTAGKGRRGRDWLSPFGSNIYLSILWIFQNGSASINGLSLAVGVAVIQALEECGVEGVELKWPNDIYWQDKKLAGILIEVSGEVGGPCSAVIGLGLNFYLPRQLARSISQDWVDLSQILADNPAKIRNKLASMLINHLMPTIAEFETDTLSCYLDKWRQYDCMKGKRVNIYMGKQVYTGIVEGIDDKGLLLLADEQGTVKAFASGEVSFRQS
ncbi:MAG: bifunctional biotin--[acetyl-CoA-carboxylase] ligase/biotin operon repressor BirA [Methylococcales bacterium]|nr:bifunctional biotin--[acetyl-CoA-carboxylase] ligase/biotin operon repressor BirA [Methylococcales bacterium]